MWDQHMHCMFSGDSDADPVLMIKSAINKGLDGICFTDHLDYDYKYLRKTDVLLLKNFISYMIYNCLLLAAGKCELQQLIKCSRDYNKVQYLKRKIVKNDKKCV